MILAGLRSRIGLWFQQSSNRRILAAALTVGGIASGVKVVAMAKELVIAYRFGTADAIDAFLIAFLLPSLAISVVTGSLNPAVTPAYVGMKERKGKAEAHALLSSAALVGTLLVLVTTVLLLAALPLFPFLGAGFGPAKLALTRALFLILLPIVVLNAFIAIWSAALNSEDRFAAAAIAPICVPFFTLVAVVIAAQFWGVYSLAVGTVVGYLLQGVWLALAMRQAGLPVLPRWGGTSPELSRAARQYFPTVAGAVLTSGSWAIGQAMAATLPSGSVASLNYGYKVVAVVSEIGSMAIATAVLPHFSLMVARREWAAVRHTLRVYAGLIAVVAIPLTLVGMVLSPAIVRLLFERGAFSPADTRAVAAIQSLYLIHVPFVMIGMMFARLAASLHRNQLLLLGAAVTLPLNVLLNAVLMRSLGAAGIALATSVVYLVSCLYLFIAVSRAMRVIEGQSTPHSA